MQPPLAPLLQNPCEGFNSAFLPHVPAVFDGMTAYKNGVKGAIATQVGVVQFKNMVLGDNGAGPKAHLTNGKDTGAQVRACARPCSQAGSV